VFVLLNEISIELRCHLWHKAET